VISAHDCCRQVSCPSSGATDSVLSDVVVRSGSPPVDVVIQNNKVCFTAFLLSEPFSHFSPISH